MIIQADKLTQKIEALEKKFEGFKVDRAFLSNNTPQNNLAKRVSDLERGILNLIQEFEKSKTLKEEWSWDKFKIGLAQYGITDSIIVSFVLLALTQVIQYLELLSIPEGQSGYFVLSGFLIAIFKSIKQVLKEKNKQNIIYE